MKNRIITALLTITVACALAACGGSKKGAETAIAADESISDLSMSKDGATAESVPAAGGAVTGAATVTPTAAAGQTTGTEIITPIPAEELNEDGTVAQTGTAAVNGTAPTGAAVSPGLSAAGTAGNTGTATDGTTPAAAGQTDETAYPKTMIATADINVRESADIDADVIGGYDEGDELTVTGISDEWYIVEYNGETGYINAQYVKASETSDSDSNSKYGKLHDGDGDPVDLRYYDGSYEIYDEDGNKVIIEGVND